jgi:hypothetical protein
MKTLLKKTVAGTAMAVLLLNFKANAQWNLTGNSATNPAPITATPAAGTHFLGTSDLKDLSVRTNNIERMRIGADGNINLGLVYAPAVGTIPKLTVQSQLPGGMFTTDITASFIQNYGSSTVAVPSPARKVNILDGKPGIGGGFINGSSMAGGVWKTYFSVGGTGSTIIGDHSMMTFNPGSFLLSVQGGIITEKVKIALISDATNWSWPDYVFKKDYKLLPLNELELFIKKNNHLPEVPSEAEVKKDGLDVAEMDAKLLKKIEELTLYMIELKKENESFRKALEVQNDKIRSLEESK